jgi:hypothetical protein
MGMKSYTCRVSALTIYNAAASFMTLRQISGLGFQQLMEEKFDLKLLERNTDKTIKWLYIIEFPSAAEATAFQLRWA